MTSRDSDAILPYASSFYIARASTYPLLVAAHMFSAFFLGNEHYGTWAALSGVRVVCSDDVISGGRLTVIGGLASPHNPRPFPRAYHPLFFLPTFLPMTTFF